MQVDQFIREFNPNCSEYQNIPSKYVEVFFIKDEIILNLNVKTMSLSRGTDKCTLTLKTLDNSCIILTFGKYFYQVSLTEAGNTYLIPGTNFTLKLTKHL